MDLWLLTLALATSYLRKMRKQTIQYTSSLDALIGVAKRLSVYENQHKMDSEDFYNEYNQGILSDDIAVLASVRHT